jgi:predicted choloylglycine hydrolase
LSDTERITNRQYNVADLGVVGLSECDGRNIRQINFNDRQIGFRIGTDDFCRSSASVGKGDINFIRRFDYVVISQDITFSTNDDA